MSFASKTFGSAQNAFRGVFGIASNLFARVGDVVSSLGAVISIIGLFSRGFIFVVFIFIVVEASSRLSGVGGFCGSVIGFALGIASSVLDTFSCFGGLLLGTVFGFADLAERPFVIAGLIVLQLDFAGALGDAFSLLFGIIGG